MTAFTPLRTLARQWANVASVVLDPLTIALGASLTTLYFVYDRDPGGLPEAVFNVAVIGLSSLLGARLAQKWAQMSEASVLVTRGTSAVRSLTVQMSGIRNLDSTIQQFIEESGSIADNPDLIRRNYQEIQRSCRSLLEQSVSAIEDWKEIVPAANFDSQIGAISEAVEAIAIKNKELETLEKELRDSAGRSATQIAHLQEMARRRADEVKNTEQVLRTLIDESVNGILRLRKQEIDGTSESKIVCTFANKAAEKFLNASRSYLLECDIDQIVELATNGMPDDQSTFIQNQLETAIETGGSLDVEVQQLRGHVKKWLRIIFEPFGDDYAVTLVDITDQVNRFK